MDRTTRLARIHKNTPSDNPRAHPRPENDKLALKTHCAAPDQRNDERKNTNCCQFGREVMCSHRIYNPTNVAPRRAPSAAAFAIRARDDRPLTAWRHALCLTKRNFTRPRMPPKKPTPKAPRKRAAALSKKKPVVAPPDDGSEPEPADGLSHSLCAGADSLRPVDDVSVWGGNLEESASFYPLTAPESTNAESPVLAEAADDSSYETAAVIEIAHAYTFKQFVDLVKKISKQIPLIFTPNGISTVSWKPFGGAEKPTTAAPARPGGDSTVGTSGDIPDNTVCLVAIVRKEDTIRYGIMGPDDRLPIVIIEADDLYNAVQSVGKRDSVALLVKRGLVAGAHDKLVCLSLASTAKPVCDEMNANAFQDSVVLSKFELNTVPFIGTTHTILPKPLTSHHTPCHGVEPNVTIPTCKLTACMLSLIKMRLIQIVFRVYPSSRVITGCLPTSLPNSKRQCIFGDAVGPTLEPIKVIHVSNTGSLLPMLSRLSSLCVDSVLRIYCQTAEAPMSIETPIGCYGELKLYIE